jgi:predicted nucleic acid-binding protein
VNYIVDACALINMANGGILRVVLAIPGNSYFIGPMVRDESGAIEPDIEHAIQIGRLQVRDTKKVPGSLYVGLLTKHGLGEGETECIAIARTGDYVVASDDRRARIAVVEELGKERLTGSIGLLRLAITRGLIDRADAYKAYQLMQTTGSFLPDWTIDQVFPRT